MPHLRVPYQLIQPDNMIISTLGLPGSGKTTASKIIAERLGLKYIGAGDVARTLAMRDEETRIELDNGRIAPPVKMREAMLAAIEPNSILDGYPRYMEQLADLYYQVSQFHHLERQTLINIVFLCDPTHARDRLLVRGRGDDQEKQIYQRIENYRTGTLPVVNYLGVNYTDTTVFVPEQRCAHDAAKVALDYIQDNWF